MTRAYAKIVSSVRPEWYVMENVDMSRKSQAYSRASKMLKRAGYGITETILDASLCGVPQRRKRFFSIGLQGAEDGFLLEH